MSLFRISTSCRICAGTYLVEVMSFGDQYLASSFVKSNEEHPLADIRIPLTVMLCNDCAALQLRESVNSELLYKHYFYRSGTNPLMRAALQDIVEEVLQRVKTLPGDAVLDIGCNDCTMLACFPKELRRVGVDPANNIDRSGLDPSIHLVNDYFSLPGALAASQQSLYKIVTSVAMFYALDDPNGVAASVKSLLAPDGLWCLQVTYLPALLRNLNFYDICHEHLLYYSLGTMQRLMERNGLRVLDASTNEVNGGSLRIYVTHAEPAGPQTSRVQALLGEEVKLGLDKAATYREYFGRIAGLKDKVLTYLRKEAGRGRLVIGLGASTKGNVLLQFFGIDKTLLPYISERNPDKVSLRTLGTDIELISEERARELNPSCMLVLIWFFKDEIVRRERAYLERGGALLFPMPYCHVVTKDGEHTL